MAGRFLMKLERVCTARRCSLRRGCPIYRGGIGEGLPPRIAIEWEPLPAGWKIVCRSLTEEDA